MRRLLIVFGLLLLACGSISANDISAQIRDSFVIADTLAATTRHDTSFTGSMKIHGFRYILAAPQVVSVDTNFANDTIFASLQYSWDNITWFADIKVDTVAPGATGSWGTTTVITDVDATVFGNYVRGLFVKRHSLASDDNTFLARVYVTELSLWVSPKH